MPQTAQPHMGLIQGQGVLHSTALNRLLHHLAVCCTSQCTPAPLGCLLHLPVHTGDALLPLRRLLCHLVLGLQAALTPASAAAFPPGCGPEGTPPSLRMQRGMECGCEVCSAQCREYCVQVRCHPIACSAELYCVVCRARQQHSGEIVRACSASLPCLCHVPPHHEATGGLNLACEPSTTTRVYSVCRQKQRHRAACTRMRMRSARDTASQPDASVAGSIRMRAHPGTSRRSPRTVHARR